MTTDPDAFRPELDPVAIMTLCTYAIDSPHKRGVVHPLIAPARVVRVLTDALDSTVWVHLSSTAAAQQATLALTRHGLSVHSVGVTVHVTGWDPRLLRMRLGILLSGIDDLAADFESTAELGTYLYDRHTPPAGTPDIGEVLAQVEQALRESTPLPQHASSVTDPVVLLDLIDTATAEFDRLITAHLAFLDTALHAYAELLTRTTRRAARAAIAALARQNAVERR